MTFTASIERKINKKRRFPLCRVAEPDKKQDTEPK